MRPFSRNTFPIWKIGIIFFIVFLLLVLPFSPLYKWTFRGPIGRVLAQANIELACPTGFTPINALTTVDQTNGQIRQNVCAAFNGGMVFQGLTSTNFQTLNGMQFASAYAGADLGAKINAAQAACSINPCTIWIDPTQGSTISSSINTALGMNYIFTPAIYTFSTHQTFQHRGINVFGNGSQFNFSEDLGNPLFTIGKNLTGTVNCNNTTTVTLVSGNNFGPFDNGDKIFIGNGSFNVVSTGGGGTTLVTTAACPTQSGVRYDGYMATSSALGSFTANSHFRDFVINYTGAGTNANDGGLTFLLTDKPYVENVGAINFANGKGVQILGVQGGEFHNLKTDADAKGLTLDNATAGTQAISANINMFFNFRQTFCPLAAGYAILIQGNAFGNEIKDGGDIEGCTATNTIQVAGVAFNNWIGPANDFENNGDSTANARDIKVTAVPAASQSGVHIVGNRFTQRASSPPGNTAIDCNTASVLCYLEENQWQSGDGYTNAWSVGPNGNGFLKNNYPQSFPHTDPGFYVLDQSGNEKLAGNLVAGSFVIAGAPILSNQGTALPNGSFTPGAGWGTGATATGCGGTPPNGFSQTFCFTITSGTASFGAAPSVSITLQNTLQSSNVPCTLDMIDLTGAGGPIIWRQSVLSTSVLQFIAKTNTGAAFTPAVTETYTMIGRCGP